MASKNLFHYPQMRGPFFGRFLSTIYHKDSLWTAGQIEMEGENNIVVIQNRHGSITRTTLNSTVWCHQPHIFTDDENRIAVVWNEVDGRTWNIRYVSHNAKTNTFERGQVISSAKTLCLPPVACTFKNELWAAWPGIEGNAIRIHVARKNRSGWDLLGYVSPEGINAFRPHFATDNKKFFLCWDQYCSGRYEILYSEYSGSGFAIKGTLSHSNERWLSPKAVVDKEGVLYITWVVLKEVSDHRGIIDHFPFAMVGYYKDNSFEYLADTANPTDRRIVADLREGLLAAETYCGYFGLRRRPFLGYSETGGLWCIWETKMESERTGTSGNLAGRKVSKDTSWSDPVILHKGGYGYSVPGNFKDNHLPVSFFLFNKAGTEIANSDFISLDRARPYNIDHTKWQRWKPVAVEPQKKMDKRITVNSKTYSIFWADTHCHSNFSADAEGEVDELIHFARDVAGIDAVCVVDNDYYPHKSLTEPEWRIHQAFSDHFTKNGRFVVFPGWEYTFHREDLDPDFNHRAVIYPRSGGKIFRRIDPETDTDYKLFEALKGTNAMCYPHHCTFEIIDPELDLNVEVCSSWRICIEETDFIINMLKNGKRFGFIGSSDTHRSVPGLGGAITGLYAEELTPESLFDAYRNRRTVATQGFFIYVDFKVGDIFIGGEGDLSSPPNIQAFVDAPETIDYVEIIRDGEMLFRTSPHSSDCQLSFKDDKARPGNHFYFLKIKLVGEPSYNVSPLENCLKPFVNDGKYPSNLAPSKGVFAWTSPIWITIK